MAISITSLPRLAVAPKRVTLPSAIDLTQDLGTTTPDEQAAVTYRLGPQHNVFFQVAGGQPVKTFTVQRTVTQASGQTFDDPVTLVQGAGEVVAQVNIGQTVTGQSGSPLHASCLVNITV
jgi:hypothetical protein